MKQEVIIVEYCDGFDILINGKRFHFDQEENKEDMVEVFKELGFEAKYEESY